MLNFWKVEVAPTSLLYMKSTPMLPNKAELEFVSQEDLEEQGTNI